MPGGQCEFLLSAQLPMVLPQRIWQRCLMMPWTGVAAAVFASEPFYLAMPSRVAFLLVEHGVPGDCCFLVIVQDLDDCGRKRQSQSDIDTWFRRH